MSIIDYPNKHIMKYYKIILISLIIISNSILIDGQSSNLSVVINKSLPSVFIVKTFDNQGNNIGLGTGFFIDSIGTGITNYHVLQSAESANIYLQDGREYPIRYTQGIDKQHDIIRFSTAIAIQDEGKTEYLEIATDLPIIGEEVFTIGNPSGLLFSAASGIVSSVREDDEYGQVIQTTTPISKGSSGSPLINKAGEVVGVLSFYIKEGQNLNFAVSSNYIKHLNLNQIYFGFPEEELPNTYQNKDESVFKRYDWHITQYEVRSTEQSLLVSDKANIATSKPELQYLIEVFGRPFELTYQFEGGKLDMIDYRAVYKIDGNDIIANSPLIEALNVFQILFGELSTRLGDDYVCWHGEIANDTDDNPNTLTQKYCYTMKELSTYLLRTDAKKEFEALDKKRGHKPKYAFLDIYQYKIYWKSKEALYILRVRLVREPSYSTNNEEANCSLGIYPNK